MAEGLLKALGSGQWKVQSAGIIQSYVHPLAIRVMEEIGIDISQQTSKSMDLRKTMREIAEAIILANQI